LLGFKAAVSLEDGMTDLIHWLDGREAVDRVDHAAGELVSRGLAG
jgi:hypothetical protein